MRQSLFIRLSKFGVGGDFFDWRIAPVTFYPIEQFWHWWRFFFDWRIAPVTFI
jgi:hypothetical protein